MAGFIEETFQKMQTNGETYVSSAYNALSSPLLTTLKTLFVIMLTWYGYQMAVGRAQVSLSELVKRLGWMVVIIAASQTYATYRSFIFDIVTKVPEEIGKILFSAFNTAGSGTSGGSGSSSGASGGLQKVWDTGWQAVSAAYAKGGITSLGSFLIALLIAVGNIFFVCIGVFIIGAAKIVSFVLIAIGPLFIALATFQWSRSWTFSWLNMLFNSMCTLIVGYAVIGFFLGIANLAISSTAAASNDLSLALKEISQFCFFCFLGGAVFLQVPQIAAGLAGGLSLDGLSASLRTAGWTRYGGNRAMLPLRTAGNMAGRNLARQRRARGDMRREAEYRWRNSDQQGLQQQAIQQALERGRTGRDGGVR